MASSASTLDAYSLLLQRGRDHGSQWREEMQCSDFGPELDRFRSIRRRKSNKHEMSRHPNEPCWDFYPSS